MFQQIGDHFSDTLNAVGKGLSKVGKSASKEIGRALDETVDHVREDYDSIAKAIDEHGLLGGAVQAADVFSPGHQLANTLDAWNVIPEDPALKELVSAGMNLWTCSPWSLLAAKDIVDSIGAIQADGAAGAGSPGTGGGAGKTGRTGGGHGTCTMPPSQGADAPRAPQPGRVSGYAIPEGALIVEIGAGCGGVSIEGGASLKDKLEEALGRFRDSIERRRGGVDGDLEREIEKILANPNLMFEDMLFLLMRAFIKSTRREVESIADDLKGTRDGDKAHGKSAKQKVDAARAALDEAYGTKDPARIQAATSALASAKEEADTDASDRAEARADKFEELKQVMQRLSEMEQALSNVLNTMHEGAMAAIRNIR